MNPNYNKTITIYNCLRAGDNPKSASDIWQRSVLHNCYYKNVIERVENGKLATMTNAYTARVPQSDLYLPYCEWLRVTEDERRELFTFRADDIVILGNCDESITGISPNTATEVLRRHKPDAFVVTAFSDNTSAAHARHYRIGG